jgi:hypothetical protein
LLLPALQQFLQHLLSSQTTRWQSHNKANDALQDAAEPQNAVACQCTAEDHGSGLLNEVFIAKVPKVASLLWYSKDWAQVYQGLRDYSGKSKISAPHRNSESFGMAFFFLLTGRQ